MLKNPRFWAGVCTLVAVPMFSALGMLIINMASEAVVNSNTTDNV